MDDLGSDDNLRTVLGGSSALTPLDWVRRYHERGWSTVPVHPRSKEPIGSGWQKRVLRAEDLPSVFRDPQMNIGVKPGDESHGLADVDLDCAETVALADDYLTPTNAIFGRRGKRRSHHLYNAPGLRFKQFRDPVTVVDPLTGKESKPVLLELRGNGTKGQSVCQTVFPGSFHDKSGEPVEWDRPWSDAIQPARVTADELNRQGARLAAAALVVRSNPGLGSRHEFRLKLSGLLLRHWTKEETKGFLGPVFPLLMDEGDPDRKLDSLVDNAEGKELSGFTSLAELIGEPRANQIAKWLEIKPERARKNVPQAPAGWRDELQRRIADKNQTYFVTCLGGKTVICRMNCDPTLQRERPVYSRAQDIRLRYDNQKLTTAVTPNGAAVMSGLGSAWLEHPDRRYHDQMVFLPEGEIPPGGYNLWRGFAVTANPGPWTKIYYHLLTVICEGDEANLEWLLNWMARCIQRPGARAEVVLVMRGDHGIGKGLLYQLLARFFRHHTVQLSDQRHVTGNFNSHFQSMLLMFLDEAFWAGDKTAEGALKRLITEPTLFIEPKGIDGFEVPNLLKLIIASNSDWVYPAAAGDRRAFVLDVSDRHKGDAAYFTDLAAAIEGAEGEAFFAHLLERDLSAFDHRNPPATKGLSAQKLLSSDSFDRYWESCLHEGYIPRPLFDGDQLGERIDRKTLHDWPDSVGTQELVKGYQLRARAGGERRPLDPRLIGKRLRKLLGDKGLKQFRPHVRPQSGERGGAANPRPTRYQLPLLEEARVQFAAALKIPADHIRWGEIEDRVVEYDDDLI